MKKAVDHYVAHDLCPLVDALAAVYGGIVEVVPGGDEIIVMFEDNAGAVIGGPRKFQVSPIDEAGDDGEDPEAPLASDPNYFRQPGEKPGDVGAGPAKPVIEVARNSLKAPDIPVPELEVAAARLAHANTLAEYLSAEGFDSEAEELEARGVATSLCAKAIQTFTGDA